MQNINFSNRQIFGNIFLKTNGSFTLLNLYSFRRMVLSEVDFNTLLMCKEAIDKGDELSASEKALYECLIEKKQILSEDLLANYFALKSKEHEDRLYQIKHKINHITISPTFSCNFNCIYCYQRDFNAKKDSLSAESIDNICNAIAIINKTDNYLDGITAVTINGGEPLQSKNINTINRIVDCFAKPGIKLHLLTNGYNILKYKEQIDFSKFYSIQVSLDNIDPFTSKINGVNHPISQKVFEGLAYLMQFDCFITISTVLSKELIANIDEFIRKLTSVGIANNDRCRIGIAPIMAFGKSTLDDSFLTLEEFIEAREQIKQKQLPRNLDLENISEVRWIKRALTRKTNERIDGRASMCSILTNRGIHFAPNGQIYWCLCADPSVGSLGRYLPEIDIDEGAIDRCIHKSVYSIPECTSCEYKYLCSSGCPLHCVAATGDYSKPFCGFFHAPKFWANLEKLLD